MLLSDDIHLGCHLVAVERREIGLEEFNSVDVQVRVVHRQRIEVCLGDPKTLTRSYAAGLAKKADLTNFDSVSGVQGAARQPPTICTVCILEMYRKVQSPVDVRMRWSVYQLGAARRTILLMSDRLYGIPRVDPTARPGAMRRAVGRFMSTHIGSAIHRRLLAPLDNRLVRLSRGRVHFAKGATPLSWFAQPEPSRDCRET